jgi:hypothetical protein
MLNCSPLVSSKVIIIGFEGKRISVCQVIV